MNKWSSCFKKKQAGLPQARSMLTNRCAITLPAVTTWQLCEMNERDAHRLVCFNGLLVPVESLLLGVKGNVMDAWHFPRLCMPTVCVCVYISGNWAVETDVVLPRLFLLLLIQFSLLPLSLAGSANNLHPLCISFSSQRYAKIANLGGWMVFCAAEALNQYFCFVGLGGIQQLIWGINKTAPRQEKKTPNLHFLEYPLHNPEPQSTDYVMDLHFWCCVCVCLLLVVTAVAEAVWWTLCSLHFGCAVPFVSACMFVSLSRSVFSLSSSLAVSASDSQQHPCSPCTISPLCASPSSLRITASHCLCVLLLLLDLHLSLFFFFLSLQLIGPLLSSDILSVYFLPSVEHVLCCCCNVSPLCVFQVSPPFLWAVNNPSQTLLCCSAWDVLLLCLSGVSVPFCLSL